MRYDDIRRSRGVTGLWLRVRLWLGRSPKPAAPTISDFDNLTDHQRQDIGLPEQPRYLDWKSLHAEERFPDFTR
jgi:hypothetical protein